MNAWNGNGPSPESHTDFRGSLLALENNLLRKRLREVLDGSADDGWELVVEFTIWGQPRPKERARQGRGGHFYTPKATVDAEKAVVDAFDIAAPLWEPTLEHVRLDVDAHYKGEPPSDGDNALKLISDALNKVAYKDDRQVRKGGFEMFDGAGNKARTDVRIYLRKN